MHELTETMKELHKQSGQAYLHLHLCAAISYSEEFNMSLLCHRLREIRTLAALAEQRAEHLQKLWTEEHPRP